ncbi:MAG TPA: isoprenylcysteine carboxylmethyltransferase family protein [Candidatus Cybelea sp.]
MRQVIVLAGSAAYFVLVILGDGGFARFFSQPPLIALTIAFCALVIAAMLAGGGISRGEREDRANRWVLIPFSLLGLALAVVPPYADRIGFLTFGGDAIRWAGLALFVIGGALRIWPVFILGNRFSGLVAIQRGHQLVTTGIYGVIRHPSYAGLLISSVGWSLAFRSALGLIFTALLVPVVIARIRSEEGLLGAHFGAEYDAYRARTARLIPAIY